MKRPRPHTKRAHYDPDVAPEERAWLALPESERIQLAENYHVAAGIKVPGMRAHAALHAVVENQVAIGYGPSKRALGRLQAEGLSRHEAVHAIASVIAKYIYQLRTCSQSPRGPLAPEKLRLQR